jgi:hypothetical protein
LTGDEIILMEHRTIKLEKTIIFERVFVTKCLILIGYEIAYKLNIK